MHAVKLKLLWTYFDTP